MRFLADMGVDSPVVAAGGSIFSVKAKGPTLPPVRKVARALRIGPVSPLAAALP